MGIHDNPCWQSKSFEPNYVRIERCIVDMFVGLQYKLNRTIVGLKVDVLRLR
jgi:hypothetical protein